MFLNAIFLFVYSTDFTYSLHRRNDYQKSFVYLIRRMNSFHFVVFFSQDLRVKLEHEREKRWVGTFSLFLQLSVLSLISFLSSYPSSRYAISKISRHGEERKICQAAQKNRNVPLKVFWHWRFTYTLVQFGRRRQRKEGVKPSVWAQWHTQYSFSMSCRSSILPHTEHVIFPISSLPNANTWIFAKYIHMCFSKLVLIKSRYFPSYQASVSA